ncbi:hypothetical protein PMAYCL1PPCAC_21731, partial [Pristionchus mayeri]
GPYCNCETKWGLPVGWNFNDIWVDIVVVVDTSEAMGEADLADAGEMIESFLSDGESDFLITYTNAAFYTRVGVIAMSDTATTLYNLNMTKNDKMRGKATIKKGVAGIDFVKAFDAAQKMLQEGVNSKPERANARQVVYYMTDSNYLFGKSEFDVIDQFKASQGVVIVNNLLKDGETEVSDSRDLASDGYYFANGDYVTAGLQSFCKANCFCASDKTAYGGGGDVAIEAAGGCYRGSSKGLPFNKAKDSCVDGGGILAVIHDQPKEVFLQQVMSSSKSDYFWIGYEKSDSGEWSWEDGSSDPYTNWDVDEPSSAAVAKCAFVDTTKPHLPWGAGNCRIGFPHVCQFAPCAVGKKDC